MVWHTGWGTGVLGGINTDEDVNGDNSSIVLNKHAFMNSSMDSKMLALYDKLTHIGIEQSICGKTLCTFGQSLEKMADKVSEVIDVSNTQSSLLKTLAYKSIDMEPRSRRNNLIF